MGYPCTRSNTYKLGNDLQFGTLHLYRMPLGKGLCSGCWSMPCYGHNPNWIHILADSQYMDLQNIQVNMNKSQLRSFPYITHLLRKVKGCRGSVVAQVYL